MKVLWIVNVLFPEVMEKLIGIGDFKSSGGWMLGAANALISRNEIRLFVATVSPLVEKLTKIDGDKIVYYVIPYGKGNLKHNANYQFYWKQINSEVVPDVVHIHGTEFSHGHAYMKECGCDNVVVSIQGLTSAVSKYYTSGISRFEILKSITLRDILRGGILAEKRRFKNRSIYEAEMLQIAKHVIGRTSWDKAMLWALNPDAEYHFCNEILRAEFYDGAMWDFKKCKRHTIFLSQASYPIKGLHQLLKAMPLILRQYPETQIRIAGQNITESNKIKDKLHLSGYGLYIKRLIKKMGLQDRVHFIGNLNAEQMKDEYLQCNVFVCPSSIENSPNSLCEAQMLGVPCIASYVGGVADMMSGNEENLYRFEDVSTLASKVCQIFTKSNSNVCQMSKRAYVRHNIDLNTQRLLEIYQKILVTSSKLK